MKVIIFNDEGYCQIEGYKLARNLKGNNSFELRWYLGIGILRREPIHKYDY